MGQCSFSHSSHTLTLTLTSDRLRPTVYVCLHFCVAISLLMCKGEYFFCAVQVLAGFPSNVWGLPGGLQAQQSAQSFISLRTPFRLRFS